MSGARRGASHRDVIESKGNACKKYDRCNVCTRLSHSPQRVEFLLLQHAGTCNPCLKTGAAARIRHVVVRIMCRCAPAAVAAAGNSACGARADGGSEHSARASHASGAQRIRRQGSTTQHLPPSNAGRRPPGGPTVPTYALHSSTFDSPSRRCIRGAASAPCAPGLTRLKWPAYPL